ncbi:MAG: macro domain-containing protein, partial [Oscillospiraceae bacterium]|nr:macro domain-containing protein [Oscillospiraceae bacterium]
MPFEIIRNDIVQVCADAIVNTANPRPVIGAGTDAGIHAAAGPELLKARKAIGPMAVGEAAVTPGFNLPAKYVIHTVGPQWQGGGAGEEQLLERCYRSCLELAGKK